MRPGIEAAVPSINTERVHIRKRLFFQYSPVLACGMLVDADDATTLKWSCVGRSRHCFAFIMSFKAL